MAELSKGVVDAEILKCRLICKWSSVKSKFGLVRFDYKIADVNMDEIYIAST